MTPSSAILLMTCTDKPGIIAHITNFLSQHKGNIIELRQHVDREENIFCMRLEWDLTNFSIPSEQLKEYFSKHIVTQYQNISWDIFYSNYRHKVAIFVSKLSHCLYDLLARYKSNELNIETPIIISNHRELEKDCQAFQVPFYYFPITAENKLTQEEKEMQLLSDHNVHLIILARYMQILSEKFVNSYPNRIINIHHSFLPAFPGARPYHSAFRRGVKIIGATSHYVTTELDEGPIIEQDVIRVTHEDCIEDFIQKGKDLEKIVLSRAVKYHLQHRILVYNNKTVVFD
ncbi:MAG: formyltetrahydrofolate deformylase [Bacteroidales bacterium]|nr:formyltetrahydrofolate deformylase [Bacteroidales bacterium]